MKLVYRIHLESWYSFRSNMVFQLYDAYFADAQGHEGFSIGPTLVRPKSRGTIKLRSSDPLDPALIDPNFLAHPDDLRLMVKGVYSPVLETKCLPFILFFVVVYLLLFYL